MQEKNGSTPYPSSGFKKVAYSLEQAIAEKENFHYKQALSIVDMVIQENERAHHIAYSIRGEILYFMGNFDDALISLKKAIANGSDNPNTFHLFVLSLFYMGKHTEAIYTVTKLINVYQRDPICRLIRAKILFHIGNFQHAQYDIKVGKQLSIELPTLHQEFCQLSNELKNKSNTSSGTYSPIALLTDAAEKRLGKEGNSIHDELEVRESYAPSSSSQ